MPRRQGETRRWTWQPGTASAALPACSTPPSAAGYRNERGTALGRGVRDCAPLRVLPAGVTSSQDTGLCEGSQPAQGDAAHPHCYALWHLLLLCHLFFLLDGGERDHETQGTGVLLLSTHTGATRAMNKPRTVPAGLPTNQGLDRRAQEHPR